MPNAANINFQEVDDTLSAGEISVGITGVQLQMLRGPIGRPDILINSSAQCQKLYGGIQATSDDTLLAMRMLDQGSQLRINNVRHYTDITDATTLTAALAVTDTVKGGLSITFTGSMSSTNTYTLTMTGFVTATQIFSVSILQTLQLLAARFNTLNPGKFISSTAQVDNALGSSTNTIQITPIPGVTLVAASLTGTGVTATSNLFLGDFGRIISSVETPLFVVSPIAAGGAYNNLVVIISLPGNGNINYFKLTAYIYNEQTLTTETYDNLKIEGNVVQTGQHWADAINLSSSIIDISYLDLSAIASGIPLVPIMGGRTYTSGTDGSSVVDTDYIGSSVSRLGFNSFDQIDDIVSIACPVLSASDVHIAGTAYANSRKDLVYFAHLSNGLTNVNALTSAKDAMLIDSSFTGFYAGGLNITDPLTGNIRPISELGDVMACANNSSNNFGMQYSFAGTKRGLIQNALGVINNFGGPGSLTDRNTLAQHQINLVLTQNKKTQIAGNFTAQQENSLLSFINVRRAIIFIKKTLGPLLQPFVEDPNTFDTWKNIYLAVTPFLDACLKNDTLYFYDWQGDQFATDLNKLVVNNKADVLNGIYTAKLPLSPVPSLQQMNIIITITGSVLTITEG